MDKEEIFKSIYDDFFGTSKTGIENEKLRKELNSLDKEIPSIDVVKENVIDRNKIIEDVLERIDRLYILDESKNILKKIISYCQKYNNKEIKEYISFNLIIYADNDQLLNEISYIIGQITKCYNYIKHGKKLQVSLYNIEKYEQLDTIYSDENNIIVIKNLEGFLSRDQFFKDKFLHKIEDKYNENNSNFLTIINAKSKVVLSQAFSGNEDIKDKLFNFTLEEIKPDVQDVYQEVLSKLEENGSYEEEFPVALLEYITATYVKSNLPFPEYKEKLCEKILFNKQDIIKSSDIPKYEKEKSLDEIFAELNSLVGLSKVKGVLNDLVSLIELKNKVHEELKIQSTNLHMVFLGNPGTGKTTVARLIAQILYNLKYIKQNKLIEVSSKDLVGEYVGQTGPKTTTVIEKAMGGVLFIDEAYTLASGIGNQRNSYNEEAVATLIQAMENNRDNLVVIFAGYTKEMQAFLDTNSGITSRIGYTLEFDDYTEDELVQIFKGMIKKAGFEITEEALEKAREIFIEYKNSENFGNARFARNLYEKTVIKHAANTKDKKQKRILRTIDKDDISVQDLIK